MKKKIILGIIVTIFISLASIAPIVNSLSVSSNIESSSTSGTLNDGYTLDDLYEMLMQEFVQIPEYPMTYLPLDLSILDSDYLEDLTEDENVAYYHPNRVNVIFHFWQDSANWNYLHVGDKDYEIIDHIPELNVFTIYVGDDMGNDPEGFIDLVKENPNVLDAELDTLTFMSADYIPNDPYWDQQENLEAINCPKAWNKRKGDSMITIAIVDTGVNINHPDLDDNCLMGKGFVGSGSSAMDDNGHGTHCAGIAAAQMDNGVGIAGVADVKILPVKVLDRYGGAFVPSVCKGIVYAASQGADVISMSLGWYRRPIIMGLACLYAFYIGNRVNSKSLIVAASGNDYKPKLNYPARFRCVVSVGATNKVGTQRADFSNWGNAVARVDCVAPGEYIISTYRGTYKDLSGTSMATPHVAGVAALYFSVHTSHQPLLFKANLRYICDSMGPDCGYGLINAYSAVKSSSIRPRLTAMFQGLAERFPLLQQLLNF